MDENGANDVVGCAYSTLSFAILRRGVGAGEAKCSPKGSKKSAVGGVVELFAIVTLDCANGAVEMSANEGVEVRESGMNVRFKTQRKAPHEVGEIVNNNQVVLATGNAG